MIAVVGFILLLFILFLLQRRTKTIVSITPPTGGEIAETFIEFIDPTINVTGLSVRLPTSYGEYTYSDNSTGPAELVKITVLLQQGDTLLGKKEYFKQTSPNVPLPNWSSEASSAGKNFTVAMQDDISRYDLTQASGQLKAIVEFQTDPTLSAQPLRKEVIVTDPARRSAWEDCTADSDCLGGLLCLKSDINGGGRCLNIPGCRWAASNDGTTPEARCNAEGYYVVNDRAGYGEWWDPYTAAPTRPVMGFSLEQCKQSCDADSSCTKIAYSATDRDCYLSPSSATLVENDLEYPSYKAYEKLPGVPGAEQQYEEITDKRPTTSYIRFQSYPNDTVAQCKNYCNDLDGCAQFWITGGTCLFYRADASYTPVTGVTTYKKVTGGDTGGGSPS